MDDFLKFVSPYYNNDCYIPLSESYEDLNYISEEDKDIIVQKILDIISNKETDDYSMLIMFSFRYYIYLDFIFDNSNPFDYKYKLEGHNVNFITFASKYLPTSYIGYMSKYEKEHRAYVNNNLDEFLTIMDKHKLTYHRFMELVRFIEDKSSLNNKILNRVANVWNLFDKREGLYHYLLYLWNDGIRMLVFAEQSSKTIQKGLDRNKNHNHVTILDFMTLLSNFNSNFDFNCFEIDDSLSIFGMIKNLQNKVAELENKKEDGPRKKAKKGLNE